MVLADIEAHGQTAKKLALYLLKQNSISYPKPRLVVTGPPLSLCPRWSLFVFRGGGGLCLCSGVEMGGGWGWAVERCLVGGLD